MAQKKIEWKTITILLAFAGAISAFAVFDSPSSTGPVSSPSGVMTPTPDTVDKKGGSLKADTFGVTLYPRPTRTPTRAVAAVTPRPTSRCSGIGVDLVLDTSSSMKEPRSNPRIDTMKEAVNNFISKIPDDAIFAAQRFDRRANNVASVGVIKENKGNIKDAIEELRPAGEGGTHVREGLYKAIREIEQGNQQFPGTNWTLILLSDGAPNPYPGQEGDEPASQLKGMGVKIITIGLDMDEEENVSAEVARDLMREMASSPSDFYDASSDDLSSIYDSISLRVCP